MDTCYVLINQTTKDPGYGPLTPAILGQLAVGLQDWLENIFCPVWGGNYATRPSGLTDGSDVGAGEAPCYFVDSLDNVPGAAAYHDRLPNGQPVIYVAANEFTDWLNGPTSASGGTGHEMGEAGADAPANRWADRVDGTEEAFEVCDRVQGGDALYTPTVGGSTPLFVPNFLTPDGFDPGSSGPYDQVGVLTSVTDQTPGGYVILRQQGAEVTSADKGQLAVVHKRIVRVVGFDQSKHSVAAIARKRHHSSRTFRRGGRV